MRERRVFFCETISYHFLPLLAKLNNSQGHVKKNLREFVRRSIRLRAVVGIDAFHPNLQIITKDMDDFLELLGKVFTNVDGTY